MFKLEFPANNKPLAASIGRALVEYGAAQQPPISTVARQPTAEAVLEAAEMEVTNRLADEGDELSQGEDVLADTSPIEAGTPASQGADVKVDLHGVPFDSDYCANAAKPFYTSGKTAGQWKKGTKVEQALYDDWYALRLKEVPAKATEPAAEIDTTAAFSPAAQNAAPAASAAPTDAGGFMVWVSEMTTAGHFTQADVTAAYGTAGIGAADIFQGDSAVANIATLHGILSAMVPA